VLFVPFVEEVLFGRQQCIAGVPAGEQRDHQQILPMIQIIFLKNHL